MSEQHVQTHSPEPTPEQIGKLTFSVKRHHEHAWLVQCSNGQCKTAPTRSAARKMAQDARANPAAFIE